ncbi:MAG: alanine racemase [Halioglobus sp.]|jgi:alanine racemase
MSRPNQARLDLTALRNNVSLVRELAPQSKLMAVVKANAYGHGAVIIAQALESQVDALAVACIEEAEELRNAGIAAPVLLLEGVFEPAELRLAAQLGLWITIENEQQLNWLEQAELAAPIQCWLKVDTGMNRLGVSPAAAEVFYQRIVDSKNSSATPVLYTHFASADDTSSDQTLSQLAVFDALSLSAPRSAANSAGLMAWPKAHYDWVRPGYMLYGNSPFIAPHSNAKTLQPVMTLTSAIISLRDVAVGETVGYAGSWTAQRPSRIATVTIGYGDGYPRMAPNGTPVLVRGKTAKLAGRVSMDMITVDVTDIRDVQLGDEVVLWGGEIPLPKIARLAGTIGYELTTRMPARTPRVILDA